MIRFSAVLVLGLMCALPGCGPGSSQRKVPLAEAQPPALSLVRAAGYDAVVTVLLRPARWPAAQATREALATLGEQLGGRDGKVLSEMVRAPSIWAALLGLSTFAGGSPLPQTLPGWDQGRPLVLGLFAAPPGDLGFLVESLLPTPAPPATPQPPVRHRLVVPATDASALRAALVQIAAGLGLRPDPEGAARLGLRDGVYRDARTGVALVPAADHVRIDVIPCRSASCPTPWQELGTAPPQPLTPALRFALAEGPLASVYVRPWRLRDHSLAYGTQSIIDALEVVEPAMRLTLGMQGWSEVAAGQLLLSEDEQETEQEDAAFALCAETGLRLASLNSLTRRGAALFSAASRSAARPLQIQDTEAPPLLRGGVALDVAVLLQQAPRLKIPGGDLERRALIEMIKECGSHCPIYLGLRRPLGTLATLLPQAHTPDNVLPYLPTALSLVFTRAQSGSPPATFAVAASFPGGRDLRLLNVLLEKLKRREGLASELRRTGAEQLLLLGVGEDPARRLGPGPMALPPGTLADVVISPARMVDLGLGRRERALLERVQALRGRISLTEEALFTEVILDLPGQVAAAFSGPPVRLGGWSAPARRASPGSRCLDQAVAGLRQAFGAVAAIAPEQRGKLLSVAYDEAKEPLACAARDPATQATAARLRRALPTLLELLASTKGG